MNINEKKIYIYCMIPSQKFYCAADYLHLLIFIILVVKLCSI